MKKLGVITFALILALGVLGTSFAAWQQTLTVAGTVAVGTYNVQLQSASVTADPHGVAVATATLSDQYTITIALSKLYPGSVEVVNFELKNNGDVPAKIAALKVNGLAAPQDVDLSGTNGNNDVTVSVSGVTTASTLAAGATLSGCHLTFTTLTSADRAIPPAAGDSGTVTFTIETEQQY